MSKTNMKNTEFYKSGRQHLALDKGRKTMICNAKELKQSKIDTYDLNPKICSLLSCDNPISYEVHNKNKFCSSSCSATHNNAKRGNDRQYSKNHKSKVKEAMQIIVNQNKILYDSKPNYCVQCNQIIDYKNRKRKTCSNECYQLRNKINGQKGGLKSASIRSNRSKNEITFYELCKDYFSLVTNNEPIFNGWDADVLIYDFKIAVLWNGDWHYREMGCYNHSLTQVQQRDSYKIKLIQNTGWTPYIIKDTVENPTKPIDAFVAFKIWISSNVSISSRN